MNRSFSRHARQGRAFGAIAGAAALWIAATASGQATPPPSSALSAAKPPTAKVPDKPPLLGNILVGLVILGAVVTASLLPSKRGHQD
jgi:hypothetical protein